MIIWRVYYDDGTTFDNTQGDPEDAPGYGVIIINQLNTDNNRIMMQRNDFYWYRSDDSCWYGGDIFGLHDQLTNLPRYTSAMKQGRTILDFDSVYRVAKNDPDFPRRAGGINPLEQHTRK